MNPPLNPKVFREAAEWLGRLEAEGLNDFACCAISKAWRDKLSFDELAPYKEFFCDLFGDIKAYTSSDSIFGSANKENTQIRIFALCFAAEVLKSGTTQLDQP
jgi:hypothetical protein